METVRSDAPAARQPCHLYLVPGGPPAGCEVETLRAELDSVRAELRTMRERVAADMAMAKAVIDNAGAEDSLAVPYIEYSLKPADTLNGDIVAAARSPSGAHCLLFGDFTGHGFPAAIAVLSAHGVFDSMVRKGHPIERVAMELNRKMHSILPADRFLSAALLEIYPDSGTISVWNGGIPEILVYGRDRVPRKGFVSNHLPLGILDHDAFDATPVRRQLAPGDLVLIHSDGITEARNACGEMFGDAGLQASIARADGSLVRTIEQDVAHFTAGRTQDDDMSLVSIAFEPERFSGVLETTPTAAPSRRTANWSFRLDLPPDMLSRSDPIPIISTMLDAVQGFGAHTAPILVVLTELYSNALEHGLLELDSGIKRTTEGFAEYYRQRESRLAALRDGSLAIECSHRATADGGILEIAVHQSRNGRREVAPMGAAAAAALHGRGTRLVRRLCHDLRYEREGCTAIATYRYGGILHPPG